MNKISVDSIPSDGENYVAPFVADETVAPCLQGGLPGVPTKLLFLSKFISRIVARACTNARRRMLLRHHNDLASRIQEDILQYGLMEPVDGEARSTDDWHVSNWTFYRNPRNGQAVSTRNVLRFQNTGISNCVSKAYFDTMYIECPVTSLASHTLYCSRKHGGVLYDCMYVDHAKKTVFAFQVSSLSPNQHRLNIGTVHNAMSGLQLLENGYRMKYFYCCSSEQRLLHRCDLDASNAVSTAQSTVIERAFDIYIARIKVFPSNEITYT